MFGPFPGFLFVGSLFHVGGQDFPLAFQRRIYGLGIEFLVENIFSQNLEDIAPIYLCVFVFPGEVHSYSQSVLSPVIFFL